MTVVGTLVGAVTLRLLENTLVAHGISKDIALIIEGAVIIAALYVQRSER
jgi:simple sugar transport system permease protein/ribose transport system permease protein